MLTTDVQTRPEMSDVLSRLRTISAAQSIRSKLIMATQTKACGDNKPNQHVAPPLTKKFVKTPPTIVLIIPLNILEKITSNFSNDALIGEGPDARVFFGELSDGQKSAIKKLDPNEKIVVQVMDACLAFHLLS